MRFFSLYLVAPLLGLVCSSSDFQQKCLSFQPEKTIFNSTRAAREFIAAGTNLTLAGNDPSCGRASQVIPADICRIALHIPTSNRSSITMELWLPEDWKDRRVLTSGNGGIDGCIQYENLAYGVQNGFVSAGANNGHNGTGGQPYLHNPDIIIDFSWRSLHTAISQAKRLSSMFYRESYHKAYYIGCSLGGRMGIGSAQRFPADFDGILAGSPATDFNHLYAWRASFYPITGKNTSANFIGSDLWAIIHQEILNQCDTLDHVEDGIIEDPSLCIFRPEALLCSNAKKSNCLNPAQVDIVNRIYSPLYGSDGKLIFPAMQPGNELVARSALYSGTPWQLSQDWYRYVLLNDSTWDQFTFNLADAMLADEINPSDIRTWPSTLAPFAERGGKIITYHGQQDNQISCFNSNRFYNHLSTGMSASSRDMDSFYRFFRISGMFHCNTGPGAWVFGQSGNAPSAGIGFHPKSNALAALVDWVENGNAPITMEGTKFVNDDPKQGVMFRRKHCRYPLRNTYKGGDASNPSNWECR
ncbi:tannase and feruloyl esterase [Rhizodiscina lignyota]|uniref:Carboxylic ester hydrolase n=1 Tax=Rhizodiscina lignyota TaxID=1504668 RepID=A0A9P4IIZ2_9PEZI|nr:tannase and feruloyl esterase [Rhizodiscina lignyota]